MRKVRVARFELEYAPFLQGIKKATSAVSSFSSSITNTFSRSDVGTESFFGKLKNKFTEASSEFNAFSTIFSAGVAKMTYSAIDAGTRIAKGLIEPITTGLQEYETQINAVQTILANTSTSGTTLNDVNDALLKLNEYADLTIYNFTQMTENIGRFTAAGIDLDTSVRGIKGIANLAAVSGSSAMQASNAMYQLSQAISTGSLKLQDWNSVVNAGMGGKLFQDELIRTARVHGIAVDEMIEKSGSFRNSLQEGWITAEVLLDTLDKFAGEVSRDQLEAIGYTQDEVDEIIRLGQTAVDAATKVKTFTQLKDVLAEAMQSTWSQSFSIIIGDFEEAKDLFTSLSDTITAYISEGGDARNKFLEDFVLFGGRRAAIDILNNSLEIFFSTLKAVREGVREVFKPMRGWTLSKYMKQVASFTDELRKLFTSADGGGAGFNAIKSVVKAFASVLNVAKTIVVSFAKVFLSFTGSVKNFDASKALESISKFADGISNFLDSLTSSGGIERGMRSIKQALETITKFAFGNFPRIDIDVNRIANAIKGFYTTIAGKIPKINLADVLDFIAESGRKFKMKIEEAVNAVKIFYNNIVASDAFKNFVEQANVVVDKLKVFRDNVIKAGSSLKDLSLARLENIKTQALSKLNSLFENLSENVHNAYEKVVDFLENFKVGSLFDKISEPLDKIKSVFDGFDIPKLDASRFDGVIESLRSGLTKVYEFLKENGFLTPSGVATVIGTIMTAGFLGGVKKFLGALTGLAKGATPNAENISSIFDALFGKGAGIEFAKGLISNLESLKGVLEGFQQSLKADALLSIAKAVGVMALSLTLLSFLNEDRLATATIAMGAISIILTTMNKSLANISPANLSAASGALIVLSGGLLALSAAILAFSLLGPERFATGLQRVGISLAGFVGVVKLLDAVNKGGAVLKASFALGVLSGSLLILGGVIALFSKLGDPTLALTTIGASLAGFVAFTNTVKADGMIKAAVALGVLSGSLFLMQRVVKAFGSLDVETIKKGLASMAVVVGTMTASLLVLGNINGASVLAASAAIAVFAGAFAIIANTISVFENLSWDAIGKALAILVGVLGSFVLAVNLLLPGLPVLAALAAMFGTLALVAVAVGTGIGVATAGIAALVAAMTGGASVFNELFNALATGIPKFFEGLANGVVDFFVRLDNRSGEMMGALGGLIDKFIAFITTKVPDMGKAWYAMILEFMRIIDDNLPEFLVLGFSILQSILDGVEENIDDITESAINIVSKFIEGLNEGIPRFITAGVGFIVALWEGIKQTMEEYAPEFTEKLRSWAEDAIDSFINVFSEKIESAKDAIKDFLRSLGNGLNDFLGFDLIPNSPQSFANLTSSFSKIQNEIDQYGGLSIPMSLTPSYLTASGAQQLVTVTNNYNTYYNNQRVVQNFYTTKDELADEVFRKTKTALGGL